MKVREWCLTASRMARRADDRVPTVVENFLVPVYGNAGELGGRIASEVTLPSASRLARAGRRDGERGARWQRTKVAERSVLVDGSSVDVLARLRTAVPRAWPLTADQGITRLVLAQGQLGLQQDVVELAWPDPPDDGGQLRLR